MINRVALSVLFGLLTKAFLSFYRRYKEVDDFGRMSYRDAVELAQSEKGTVAQQERLLALSLMNLHAATDAHNLNLTMQRIREASSQQPKSNGHYL